MNEPEEMTGAEINRTWGGRRLTAGRRFLYRLMVPLGKLILEILWRSGRLQFIGEGPLIATLAKGGTVIPVCWHQHLLFCGRYIVAGRLPGLAPAFLVSPSVDGEAPSMLAISYNAQVVRGSSTHTGTRAIRHLCKALARDRLSPLITPDGPRGPRFEFKPGALLVAQLTGAPIVPLAYAAKPANVFRTWDKFILPTPFARIVIAVGEPMQVPRDADEAQREALRAEIERRMLETYQLAKQTLDA